jgi:hypothetical protein
VENKEKKITTNIYFSMSESGKWKICQKIRWKFSPCRETQIKKKKTKATLVR